MKSFITGAIVGITLTVLILMSMSAPAQADEPASPLIPTRSALRDAFACPGMHAEWLDGNTVQCLKESPM